MNVRALVAALQYACDRQPPALVKVLDTNDPRECRIDAVLDLEDLARYLDEPQQTVDLDMAVSRLLARLP